MKQLTLLRAGQIQQSETSDQSYQRLLRVEGLAEGLTEAVFRLSEAVETQQDETRKITQLVEAQGTEMRKMRKICAKLVEGTDSDGRGNGPVAEAS